MEIWGGNQEIAQSFEAPGLDIYVQSRPYQGNQAGGDIYYLTSCASGRVSRFLLADVSGHGDAAAGVARSLRDLLRQNVNKISQEKFVEAMNREFGNLNEESGFATAVVATFFEPTKSLDISVAGHPYPLYYRESKKRWVHLDPASGDETFENMPFGIVQKSGYPGRKVSTKPGDMFLLYTDAFVESMTKEQGDKMLGVKGMLKLLNDQTELTPDEVIPFLRDKIGSMAEGNLNDDDASMILGHFTQTKIRLRDNLMAPIRLFGDVCDATSFRKDSR